MESCPGIEFGRGGSTNKIDNLSFFLQNEEPAPFPLADEMKKGANNTFMYGENLPISYGENDDGAFKSWDMAGISGSNNFVHMG